MLLKNDIKVYLFKGKINTKKYKIHNYMKKI